MTTPTLPARVSLGFRKDKRLSFTGLDENRTLAQCDLTIAIRALLQDLYADAKPCEDTNIAKPRLGNHFRIRWTTQGGAKLRFYLATVKKLRPKFDVPGEERTARLRAMVQKAYDLARTDGQRSGSSASQSEEDDYTARLLAGEIVEPTS